jgi:hypothetical protein
MVESGGPKRVVKGTSRRRPAGHLRAVLASLIDAVVISCVQPDREGQARADRLRGPAWGRDPWTSGDRGPDPPASNPVLFRKLSPKPRRERRHVARGQSAVGAKTPGRSQRESGAPKGRRRKRFRRVDPGLPVLGLDGALVTLTAIPAVGSVATDLPVGALTLAESCRLRRTRQPANHPRAIRTGSFGVGLYLRGEAASTETPESYAENEDQCRKPSHLVPPSPFLRGVVWISLPDGWET